MKRLFFIAVTLASIYAGYWFIGSTQVETRARAALADLEAQGWKVDYESLETAGFPSRFDTTVVDLSLVSPDGRIAWDAPFVQLFALSYRPNRVIAVWPEEQTVTLAGQAVTITSDRLRASAAVGLSTEFPLNEATVEGDALSLRSDGGWTLSMGTLLAAIRQAGPAPATYDVYLGSEAVGLPLLAEGLDLLRIDGRVTLDAPLDSRLRTTPRLVGLALREARLASSGASISAVGELASDRQGLLSGTLTLRAERWRDLLAILEASGVLVLDQAAFLSGALEQLSGGEEDIELPITFRNGQVEALGVVLLPAPRVL